MKQVLHMFTSILFIRRIDTHRTEPNNLAKEEGAKCYNIVVVYFVLNPL